MSNSYRKTPIIGNCSGSDKDAKVFAHRALRAAVRTELAGCVDYEEFVTPHIREVSDVWLFPKDGKRRMDTSSSIYEKYMRK